MPSELKKYRIFIASPSGLDSERKSFDSEIDQYNRNEAIPRDVFFQTIGWEQVSPGMGRPQSLINEELKECDFFVLLLYNRWGSNPGENLHRASSGTEEEYYVALECYHDKQFPMRDLACFFKSLSPEQLAEPDEELQKVLNFKMKLESEKKQLFGTFSSTREFETLLRRALAKWLRAITGGKESEDFVFDTISTPESPSIIGFMIVEKDETETISKQHVENAWSLVSKGRITEAEIEFSRAIRITPKTFQLLSYSSFLIVSGQLMKAMSLIDQSMKESISEKRFDRLANSLTVKSRVKYLQGNISEAESLNRKALRYYLKLEYAEGIATVYQNLGKILLNKGNFREAEEMFLKALDLYKRDQNETGRADLLESLGTVFRIMGQTDRAEKYFTEAMAINKRFNRPIREASNFSELGKIKQAEGYTKAALRMQKKALKIYRKTGYVIGIADQYGNLGNIFLESKKIELAEKHYNESLSIYKQLGKPVGIAANLGNLGTVLVLKNDIERGEEMYRKSLAIYEYLNDLSWIGNQYRNLGLIYLEKNNLDVAEEFSRKALDIFYQLYDQQSISGQLGNIADLNYRKGNFRVAETNYKEALAIADKHGYKSISQSIKERLKLLERKQG